MTTQELKAILIHAAYTGAVAVCEPLIAEPGPVGGTIPIDPLIQDTGLRAKGVLVYEEAKVQYAAILRALADQTGIWPDPVAGSAPASGPTGTTPANPPATGSAQAAINKFAGAIAGVAQAVEPLVPGADLVDKAASAVAAGTSGS
jgi:hypothetical protein